MKDTDDSHVKKKTKFLPDKNNNCKLNTFFKKLWNINLKKQQRITFHKNKNKP